MSIQTLIVEHLLEQLGSCSGTISRFIARLPRYNGRPFRDLAREEGSRSFVSH